MSLRVWLPLNGDLKNNGTADITVTNNGATVDNNGKIGKCYYFNGSNQIKISLPDDMTTTKNTTVMAWVKSTGSVVALGGISYDNSTYGYSGAVTLYTSGWQFPASSGYKYVTGGSIANSQVWHHVACTVGDDIITTYLDGVVINTNSLTTLTAVTTLDPNKNFIEIGQDSPGTDERLTGYVNDFRVYDHCLSTKEIKEISKGLVCHYKLDSKYSTNNLIINGFGELGNENWTTSSAISTTEIPPNHSEIKASFYNWNMTEEYIPINPNHSYTISAYLKTTGATTGTTYPSIWPYDYDKKFIAFYNSTVGFSNAYKTTLAQPLKKGDTKIYATNLSAWTTADTNYYFHVAIFGYKDSSGYVYPDMVYTADSPSFGSKTDKSNIDKTNNIITLKAPFTGEDRPAGTTICQATEGSTYYYPFGGVALANIQDWTLKTATFVPKNDNRLKVCKYIRWQAYSGAYYAGNKLVDNNDNSNLIIDSSGYRYHGSKIGELTVSNNSARNSISTNFNGVDNAIKIPFNEMLGLTTAGKLDYTISVWTYKTGIGSKAYQTILGGQSGFELEARNAANTDAVYVLWNWGKGTASYNFNEWTLFTFVHTINDCKLYVNGELKVTGTSANIPIGDFFIGAWQTTAKQNFQGRMSDFRIYATALSADDILELYQVGAKIDKSGNMYGYELKED